MMRKTWRLLALLAVMALVAAACGSDGGAADELTIEDGKLTLVTTGNFPPFTLINPDTGDVEGYSIDVAREVADRLGLELELPTVDFVAELQGLKDGLYDIADSGINPTPARQEDFLFTRPMTSAGIIAQVRAEDAGGTGGLGDMAGKNVGGIQGSFQEGYVVNCVDDFGCASYSGFAGAAEALLALEQGRVDMLSQDSLVAANRVVTQGLGVAGPTVEPHPLSMVFRQGNEALRDAIDPILNEMIADGTLAEIQKKWFASCIPVPGDINEAPPYDTMPSGC